MRLRIAGAQRGVPTGHGVAARRAGRLLLPIALLASVGCYKYTPLAPTDLRPGQEVLAELGDQGAAELARWIGPRGVSLRGRLQTVTDSAFTIQVTEVVRRNGVTEPWIGETLLVPRPFVATLGERRFDRRRTLLLGLGVVAGLVGIDAALGDAGVLFRGRGGNNPGQRQ